MAHHKRRRPKNRRGGCLYCKPWKANGERTEGKDGERFSDHRRRVAADLEIEEAVSAPSVRIGLLPFVEEIATVANTGESTGWLIL